MIDASKKTQHSSILLSGVTVVCLLFLSFHPSAEKGGGSWKLKKEVDGIKIFIRPSKNSNLKELKTVTHYKTSLSNLVNLIADKESYPKWVYGCSKSYYLKKVKENESYHYQQTNTPWPLSNRDMVVHNVVQQDSISRVVTITSTGVPEYIPHKNALVRVPQFYAYWKFTPLPKDEIEVEYFMSLDPGGEIPDWVVNLAVTEGPVKTLKNMEAILRRSNRPKNLSYIKD